MRLSVRTARAADAADISRVVLHSLRETNIADYSPDIIERVGQSFSSAAVTGLMARRLMFVAIADDEIVGTASLDGNVVRTVFVAPTHQGLGIGRMLMAKLEENALARGADVLLVPSTITAERFYRKLGFLVVGDRYHGEERTIVMQRRLAA